MTTTASVRPAAGEAPLTVPSFLAPGGQPAGDLVLSGDPFDDFDDDDFDDEFDDDFEEEWDDDVEDDGFGPEFQEDPADDDGDKFHDDPDFDE